MKENQLQAKPGNREETEPYTLRENQANPIHNRGKQGSKRQQVNSSKETLNELLKKEIDPSLLWPR
jgi:hypothetical protein